MGFQALPTISPYQVLPGCRGSELRSSCLFSKYFTHLAHLPNSEAHPLGAGAAKAPNGALDRSMLPQRTAEVQQRLVRRTHRYTCVKRTDSSSSFPLAPVSEDPQDNHKPAPEPPGRIQPRLHSRKPCCLSSGTKAKATAVCRAG